MGELDSIWKTKDCFDCPLKREDVCYWGVRAKSISVYWPDGSVHKRKKCDHRWKPQPENHVALPTKGEHDVD